MFGRKDAREAIIDRLDGMATSLQESTARLIEATRRLEALGQIERPPEDTSDPDSTD